jgi:DNA repair exonuclease SbcCD nuclease subunit
MTTLVCVSDLHLDQRTAGVSRFEEIARGLRQAKDEAIKRKADIFICAGDVGDPDSGSVVYRLLALCAEVMADLDSAGVSQLWVKGNHDGEEGESLFTPLKAFMDDKRGEVAETADYWGWPGKSGKFDVLALPHAKYNPELKVRDFIDWKGPPRPTVVVSHLFPIPGIEPGEETKEMPRGGPRPLPCEALAQIPGQVIILSGHWHKRQIYQPPVPGCPPVHVIGSLCQLSHAEESNQPGFLCLEF